jgi:hypothetical protein
MGTKMMMDNDVVELAPPRIIQTRHGYSVKTDHTDNWQITIPDAHHGASKVRDDPRFHCSAMSGDTDTESFPDDISAEDVGKMIQERMYHLARALRLWNACNARNRAAAVDQKAKEAYDRWKKALDDADAPDSFELLPEEIKKAWRAV